MHELPQLRRERADTRGIHRDRRDQSEPVLPEFDRLLLTLPAKGRQSSVDRTVVFLGHG